MTTYSGEDGMTGTDDPALPPEPTPYGADPGGSPDVPPPAFETLGYYVPAADDVAYNASDVLPATPPGGRRARRVAEAAEKADVPPQGPKAVVAGTPSGPGRAIVPAALAIVSAVALAAAWMHLESDRSDQPAASSSSAAPSTSPSTAPSGSPTPRPSASASSKPSTSPSSVASPAASTTVKPATAVDRSVPVVVLNATGRPGLAAKVAAKLRAEGWKVTSVGNWTKGGIGATTVYLNGHVAARDTIIKDLPQAGGRVELPLAGMPPLRMVVVVGKDYPA